MTNVVGALYWTLDPDVCRRCKVRAFKECHGKLLPDGFRRQRLMLATDGSEFSRAPTEVAIALAQRFGVTLDVMTSVESAAQRETAEARLMPTVREAAAAGVASEEIVRHGKNPVEQVAAAVAAADTNILVIGRRPPVDLRQKLLGDRASHLIAETACHVLVVPARARMWQQRILLASDGSETSDGVADVAMQVAKATRTPVTIVTAISSDRQLEDATEDLAQKAGLMKLEGIEVETKILRGPASESIANAAVELGADLVVVGSHRGKGLSRMMADSVVDRVVGGLDCAVLIVKSGDAGSIGTSAAG
ncbi:MAG TPA: universal stress protein, partial [Rhodocyclaceae bacterium]